MCRARRPGERKYRGRDRRRANAVQLLAATEAPTPMPNSNHARSAASLLERFADRARVIGIMTGFGRKGAEIDHIVAGASPHVDHRVRGGEPTWYLLRRRF